MNSKVFTLFPKTVLSVDLSRELTDDELAAIKEVGEEKYQNAGNKTSLNRNVLDLPSFSFLREEITNAFNEYMRNILMIGEETQFKLTQSWLNYTTKSEFHHVHKHPNSYLSAVVYLESDDDDKIYFEKDEYQQIRLYPKEYNQYNSESWWLPTPKGKIYVFPSSITHRVEARENDGLRVSLAANMFPVGYIGDNTALTELIL